MNILAVDTAGKTAAVAVLRDDVLLYEAQCNNGLTHSETLLPMIDTALKAAGLTVDDLDVLGVTAGPGSFTGLRIGLAVVKGLALPRQIPCAGVSTLEAMAWPLAHLEADLCAVMDARRNQVYNARFQACGGILERLCPDRAIPVEELALELENRKKPHILVGDGAELCYNELTKRGLAVALAPPHLRLQSAWGVARGALELARQGALVPAAALAPVYHRLSQAERERLAKVENSKGEEQHG